MKQSNKSALGRIAILAATLAWGTSFVILKNTLNYISTFYILSIRFLLAGIVMMFIGSKDLKKIDKDYLKSGILMGIFIFAAYVFQTFGLSNTTPGKNAFLTSIYCVITPFLCWLIYKKRPNRFNFIAAFICICGIGFISLNGDMSISLGDWLTIVGGFFFAAHLIVADRGVANRSVAIMTMLQFVTSGILCLIAALIFEPVPTNVPASTWLSILYLCLVCTALCYFLQLFGQKHTPPAQSAVLLTLESVFGTILSIALGQESLTPRLVIGFVLTFISVVVSETKLEFLFPKGKNDRAV